MKAEKTMKTKDIVELVIALLIFLVAAYFIYTLLTPKHSSKGSTATVTQVTPLATNFDSSNLQTLTDTSQTQDFYTPPDLHSGLGNAQPFGH